VLPATLCDNQDRVPRRPTFESFAIVKRIVGVGGQFRELCRTMAGHLHKHGRLMVGVIDGLADVGA